MRKIFGPVREGEIWRRRTNAEIYALINQPEIVQKLKTRRLRWLGHVERREEDCPIKATMNARPTGKRPLGRPKKRWLDEVMQDMEVLSIEGDWRQLCRDRTTWRRIVTRAHDLQGR